MALLNDNWIYEDDNSSHSKKAKDILRKVKAQRQGKKYKHVTVCLTPLTIVEKEDVDGQELYSRGSDPYERGSKK